jgi:hypothetical protein
MTRILVCLTGLMTCAAGAMGGEGIQYLLPQRKPVKSATQPIVKVAAFRTEGPATPAAPTPTITLSDRHGHAVPQRAGFEHTGGGNIDVAQPTPDTVVVTMTGVAVAGAHPCKDSLASMDLSLDQCFEIGIDKPEGKKLKLTVEGRVIGLLRSPAKGNGVAEESSACASILCGSAEVLTVCAPVHSVSAGENLSINDHAGPLSVIVVPGKYTLHEAFHVAVSHPRSLFSSKAASAEFAPDPALDPLWISYFEPFHGAIKKDFGFQVTIKVAAE